MQPYKNKINYDFNFEKCYKFYTVKYKIEIFYQYKRKPLN